MKTGNYLIANLISRLNFGIIRRLRFIKININDTTLNILNILYKHGVIRAFIIKKEQILVYYKYNYSRPAAKFSIISTPGNKIFWSLNKLSYKYNNNNFSGFYIISTQKGIYTSHHCLLDNHTSGKILIKVEI
jgi:ribosomal protein S8